MRNNLIRRGAMNNIKVSDIVKHVNGIADPGLAMDWDNVGLQLGLPDNMVNKVMLTLDVTSNAVEYAIKNNIDMIISHHPLIFRSLKKITDRNMIQLIKNDIAVYCAHTNLDVVKKGVNFALAEKLKLKKLQFLSTETGSELLQVAVYVPQDSMDELAGELFKRGAGIIGDYSHCLSDYEVSGQYLPGIDSDPTVGEKGKLEKVIERKLEFLVDSFKLEDVLSAIKAYHPYETPVYTVTHQERDSDNYGLGLIGELDKPLTIEVLAKDVKDSLDAPFVRLWLAGKNKDSLVKKIAVCGGSGTSLLAKTYGKADLYISADFSYHTLLDSQIPLIDAGHFHTEIPVMENLKRALSCFDLNIVEFPREQHEINNLKII
jgi:dinuclear metal center YbgI/SA1388 family protein